MNPDTERNKKLVVMAAADSSKKNPVAPRDTARPQKRSFTIAGHKTSISLEAAFWDALKDIAARDGRAVSALVADIDAGRGDAGLSSSVRVWILARALADRGEGNDQPKT